MPPARRSARGSATATATASPSPRSKRKGQTPARGGLAQTPIPIKYSTSYGSPMTQLPDRAQVGGGGNISTAAAKILSTVKQDNVAAEARRRVKDQTRAARAGSRATTATPPPPPPPPPPAPPKVQAATRAEAQSDDQSDYQGTSGEEGSEYGDEPDARRSSKSPKKSARKRTRDDDDDAETEADAEKERKERDARLKRERAAEARRLRNQKQAEAEAAAAEKAEQKAREVAEQAAMPPPSQPPTSRPAPDVTMTPAARTMAVASSSHRPSSARSFIEEVNLFREAEVQTPKPPSPKNSRRPGPPAPAVPPTVAPPAAAPAPASPPSVLKRPPRRPGGTTPASRLGRAQSTLDQVTSSPSPGDNQERAQQPSPPDSQEGSSFTSQLRNRFQPVPGQASHPENRTKPSETSTEGRSQKGHFLSLWSILKGVLGLIVLLQLIRFAQSVVRPELFEQSITWHGWGDMKSNVAQFFPLPLLQPRGVLTNAQYDDLKKYLNKRTTSTEAAVDRLKYIMPKVVSVRKDRTGGIEIADEFWAALEELISQDTSILTLDRKSHISEKHWKAIEQRLGDAGLLTKPLSAHDVEAIVENKSGPSAWERWLRENKIKVEQPKSSPRAGDETLVSKEAFIHELNERLAKSKKDVTAEMETLRKDLDGLLRAVKTIASDGGMSRSETAALLNKVVDREISRRLSAIGSRHGVHGVDAVFRNRVNHFAPGNAAIVDVSISSPTFQMATARVGTKEWLKMAKNHPQFLPAPFQALSSWTDAGHCWCAGTLGARNRTLPADLGIRLPQFVIPQHIVLEHISPDATTDPDSMPRDVEVWALFEDRVRREHVFDWMAVAFPNIHDARDGGGLGHGWVKISQFTYEHRPQDEGVYVHALSRDLVERVRAATDSVVIRAVTNYGARDHTCFYRVRMYGEIAEDVYIPKDSKRW